MDEPSLKISPADIGKVLSRVAQWTTQESQQLQHMMRGRFEQIMGLVESDVSLIMMVHNCTKNPDSKTCLKIFRDALLRSIVKKEMEWWEKLKRASEGDEDEEDPLGELGKNIQILSLEDWHSQENIEKYSKLALDYINLFIGFYDLSDAENEDDDDDDDFSDDDDDDDDDDVWHVIEINPYDMSILKTIVSAAQSYILYLNTDKERLLAEKNTGRWHQVRTFVEWLRWLSFQSKIGKWINSMEYKYTNTILELLVKWDVLAMAIKDIPGWERT